MKKTLLFLILCFLFPKNIFLQNVLYKDPMLSIDVRVDDLIKRMTLEEKLLQLSLLILRDNNVNNISRNDEREIPFGIGSLIYFADNAEERNRVQRENIEKTRLAIPILFGFDVIHGFKNIYPIPLAQSCSWNPDLSRKLSRIAAYEAYNAGINWTFSPMIDVSRDPRWGRVAECYGEDPYTNSIFGVATVKGYQGNDYNEKYTIASCLKHFVGYGASEGGRDYRYTEISSQSLWDTYLPPYKACISAGSSTIMSSFNDISGTPATCNYYTLTEILRNRWGFTGFVVSDWDAVEQLVYQGVAKNRADAGKKAFTAGVDMNMKDMIYYDNFKQLVNDGLLDMSLIDRSVKRILRLKFQLGLFEHPYTKAEKSTELEDEIYNLCSQMAEESYVLLKNDKVLPISQHVKSIALIGPMAKDKENLLGSWSASGKADYVESLYEGLIAEFGNSIEINYSLGSSFTETSDDMLNEAKRMAEKSDVIILCLGEQKHWSGENASRSTISLPKSQELLAEELNKIGKPIILVLSSGRPLELCRLEPLSSAILEIWQPGVAGGRPFAGILSGRINPSGKLSMTFPYSTGQIPIYYNMRQSARPFDNLGGYQDIQTNPLYNFGYGLSYTTYKCSDIKVSKTEFTRNETIIAEVDVTNIGNKSGKETVLWYISDPASSISRPIKELKYFEKKRIQKGKTERYKFEIIPERDLSFVDSNGNKQLETGVYILQVYDKKVTLVMTE